MHKFKLKQRQNAQPSISAALVFVLWWFSTSW